MTTLATPLLLPAVATSGAPTLDTIHCCDALTLAKAMPANSVHCIVTSPPYFGLRSYIGDSDINKPKEIGLEDTPRAYIDKLVALFHELRRVLRDDGTCWINLGDSYSGAGYSNHYNTRGARDGNGKYATPTFENLPSKSLLMMPARLAIALQDDGWILRSEITWCKPAPMPESVTDRPTKATERIYLLAKSERYFYDADAIREPQASLDPSHPSYRKALLNGGTYSQNGRRFDAKQGEYGINPSYDHKELNPLGRNKRDWWVVNSEPMKLSIQTSRLSRVGVGAVSYGMKHIVTPSCPVHGGLFDRVAMAFYDGLADSELTHTLHTCRHHALELSDADLSTNETHSDYQRLDSWDYAQLECFLAAIDRSIQNRKRVHGAETSLAYTPFAETLSRTDDKLVLLASFVRHLCKHESSILPDEMDVHLLGRIPHRTVDKSSLPISSDCSCVFYQTITRDTSHFATFPTKLIEPMILAGCPAQCCSVCGKGWVREVETIREFESHSPRYSGVSMRNDANDSRYRSRHENKGFRPACDCHAETVPGVVYDPFMGAGTTALVARRLGRQYIGSELNSEYVKIARERLRLPFEEHHVTPKETDLTGLPLFAQVQP